MRGYFVAMRMTPSRRSASPAGSSPSTAAHTMRQPPGGSPPQAGANPAGGAAVAGAGAPLPGALALPGEAALAGDPQVGGPRLDVGRDVGRPHGDDARLGEQQLAVVGADLGGVD